MPIQTVIQSSKSILLLPYLPSLPCPNICDITITINRSTKSHKLTDKLYITCLLMVQLLCKIYILWKNQKYLQNFVR